MIVSDWIIIVDDNATDLQIAESALKNTGINTTLLKTGRELLDYLQQSASVPDLLLINIFMRDMDGFEILKAVRHLKDGRANIPVISYRPMRHKRQKPTDCGWGLSIISTSPSIPTY
jgi:CheY-like chemotaxis protein